MRDLIDEKLRKNEKLCGNDLKYIFKFLVQFVLLLKEYNYVHNDIKTENLVLVKKNEKNDYSDKNNK